ncbi:uncharacterized protein [Elaeis guineensis]|uniref:uncharacterized protein isoform X2 n=1 Tax=Elaeis guineensis var. tenera TaxID=51953 RepID=UPI003C6D1FAB
MQARDVLLPSTSRGESSSQPDPVGLKLSSRSRFIMPRFEDTLYLSGNFYDGGDDARMTRSIGGSTLFSGGVMIVHERKVEINEAWKGKALSDPTVFPKGKARPRKRLEFL